MYSWSVLALVACERPSTALAAPPPTIPALGGLPPSGDSPWRKLWPAETVAFSSAAWYGADLADGRRALLGVANDTAVVSVGESAPAGPGACEQLLAEARKAGPEACVEGWWPGTSGCHFGWSPVTSTCAWERSSPEGPVLDGLLPLRADPAMSSLADDVAAAVGAWPAGQYATPELLRLSYRSRGLGSAYSGPSSRGDLTMSGVSVSFTQVGGPWQGGGSWVDFDGQVEAAACPGLETAVAARLGRVADDHYHPMPSNRKATSIEAAWLDAAGQEVRAGGTLLDGRWEGCDVQIRFPRSPTRAEVGLTHPRAPGAQHPAGRSERFR